MLSIKMNYGNLKSMSVDQFWNLHELVVTELSKKIATERACLKSDCESSVPLSRLPR